MTTPIVGVLAAATRDHLLLDALLHKSLCRKDPDGRVVCELYKGSTSIDDIFTTWENSHRQCSLCAKRLKKRQKEERD